MQLLNEVFLCFKLYGVILQQQSIPDKNISINTFISIRYHQNIASGT